MLPSRLWKLSNKKILLINYRFIFHSQSELGRKKGDFIFQTGHVIEIVTKMFLVIQNATNKPPEIQINPE